MRWFGAGIALGVAALVSWSAPSALAVSGQSARPSSIVFGVHTVSTFSYDSGQLPENILLNPDGSEIISMLGSLVGQPPELVLVSPSGRSKVILTGQQGDTFAGLARGSAGTIYYNVVSSDASRSGVWSLLRDGSTRLISALPPGTYLNGLAINATGSTLYIADSLGSKIWTAPASGGPARVWLDSPALAPTAPEPDSLGANGLRFHDGAVWVSDTNQGTLMRVPVTAAGTAGPIDVVARGLVGIDDFNFLTDRSDVVFTALNAPGEVAVVYPDGTSKIVLTTADGLDSPSATAISGTKLFITDGGYGVAAPNDPELQSATISIAALRTGGH